MPIIAKSVSMLGVMRSRTPSVAGQSRPVSRGSLARESDLYVRPYTPTVDYTPSLDMEDARSRDLQLGSVSEFSVSHFHQHNPGAAAAEPDRASQSTLKGPAEGGRWSDSGVESGSQSSPSQLGSEAPFLQKAELGTTAAELCRELRTVTSLSLDFIADVAAGEEAAADLLTELETKIRPFLITLDEEMSGLEAALRANLDGCRISELRVSWLLIYNKFTLTFRQSLNALADKVFEPVEGMLRLRDRGCEGLKVPADVPERLQAMAQRLAHIDQDIRRERSLQEEAYA